jgi:hypothetical protein
VVASGGSIRAAGKLICAGFIGVSVSVRRIFQLPTTLTTQADPLIGENLESKESLVIPC